MKNKIKSIKAKNFKGQTFTQPLTAVTVITGRNAKGKSSRIEAATLAQLKYLPGFSKKPNDIFREYASGNPMAVEVEFDNGNLTGVCFEESRGSVKCLDTGNGRAAIPPVAFDANEYFALSGAERTKFIFSRAKLDLTIDKLTNNITANIKNIKLEENTPSSERVIKEICEIVSEHNEAAVEADATPQKFIEELYDDIKDKLKLANENAKRMASTVQGLTQIKEASTAATDIEVRIAKARQELESANAEVARLRSESNTLKNQLAEAESKRLLVLGEQGIRDQIATLEQEIEKLKLHPTSAIITKEQSEAFSKANTAHNESVRACDNAVATVKRYEKEIEDVKSMTNCPTCGQSLKSKREKLEVELMTTLQKAQTAINQAEEQFNLTAETLHNAETALDDARRAQETHTANLTALNNKSGELAGLQKKLSESAVAADAVNKIPAMMEKAAGLKTDYDNAAAVSIEKKSTHDNLDGEYRKMLTDRAEAKQRATALDESDKKKTESLVLKETKEMLEALQEEIVKQSVQPILDQCNALCGDILRLPLAFKDGEIGFADKTGFVSHRTMSDSEKLLTYASLSIALAAESPFKFCVIGRFESFDIENRILLIERALAMVEKGTLDQCLFVEVGETKYRNQPFDSDENFSVIEL